ncbi:hypothetical protein GALMADRAFT_72951, partial [Galerina marginata CBS 339.88]
LLLCTAPNFGGFCASLPFMDQKCICFTGGLTILNKEVSSAIIPQGIACTFFEAFSCFSSAPQLSDEVVVNGSTSDFASLLGISGTQNFTDLSSSFVCSVP